MQEKRFHREDYPLDILSEFGLTEEMIYDLPDFVHENIEMGGKSPLLPITIQQPFGETQLYAKFCLFETENGMDVLFFPKLKSINLDQFAEHDKKLLLAGKVIVADIEDRKEDADGVEPRIIKAFVQIDKDTNDVLYAPPQVIGRNLSAIAREYDLDGEQLQRFWKGELVTITESNDQGIDEPVTIGVDLFSDKGVVVIPGTADLWENIVRRTMPEYSFGNDGCWVNRQGQLQYVPEDEFTKEIYDVLNRNARAYNVPPITPNQEENNPSRSYEGKQEEARQHTR